MPDTRERIPCFIEFAGLFLAPAGCASCAMKTRGAARGVVVGCE